MPRHRLLELLFIVAIVGCGSSSEKRASPPAAPPLRVAAASDLQAVLPVLADRFRATRGIEVVPVFGSSGNLARQIAQGAPFDVFLSANRAFVDDLVSRGVIRADSVAPYAEGSLVLAVGRPSWGLVQDLSDLTKPEVKHIAVANPDFAPYGVAAREALASAGLDAVGPKLAIAESVRQALQYVHTGNAEVGLVAHSIAVDPDLKVIELDQKLYGPIVQYLGIVSGSSNLEAARAFTNDLSSEQTREVLDSYGFRPAGSR
jgi:molybdate transport system substrate-binding protein